MRAFLGVLSAFRFEMKERSGRGSKTPNSHCFVEVVFVKCIVYKCIKYSY